jgi:hypothetical protein
MSSDQGNGRAGKFRSDAESENSNKKLAALANKANDCHWQYHNGIRALLPYAKTAGQALIEAKELAGHGNWIHWLEHNFNASVDRAERYLAIACNWDRVEKLLAEKPKATVEDALRRIKGRDPATSVLPATRVIVELTAVEEARRNLLKRLGQLVRQFGAIVKCCG